MPSPFPGMNPYLERDAVWHDFHQSFITAARDAIAAQVRPKYVVKLEEHIYIHELTADERYPIGKPDLSVLRGTGETTHPPATKTSPAPAYGRLPVATDVERESFIEIRDRENRELVTAIELLSPSNKRPGPDRNQYLLKRQELLRNGAHFIELDLLRGGPRLPVEELPECDYYALVSRVEDRPTVGIWPLSLRDRLPTIPVPLRTPDPDARLDLQSILNRVYDAAGYADYIYDANPQPPLTPADAGWAAELVRS